MDGFQREVGEWADRTFPRSDWFSICGHLREEATELSEALGATAHDQKADAEARTEAADCLLLLLHLAHKEGFDLLAEARAKHAVNVARTWETDDGGKGYWKHTDPAPPTREGEEEA